MPQNKYICLIDSDRGDGELKLNGKLIMKFNPNDQAEIIEALKNPWVMKQMN